jgi:hypothetical protein
MGETIVPVTIERVEPHVYLCTYSESPLFKEVFEVIQQRKAIADDHHETYFVSVVDLTRFHSMLYDVSSIKRAVAYDRRNMRTLAIGAPLHVRAVVEAFRPLLGLKMEFYESPADALVRARQLLDVRRLRDLEAS